MMTQNIFFAFQVLRVITSRLGHSNGGGVWSCRFTSYMSAVGEVSNENRESTVETKEQLLGLLCSQRSCSLRANLRNQPFTELSESMSSSISPRVGLARLTTEATALSTENETRQCVEQAYRGPTSCCYPPWNYSTRNIRCRHRQHPVTSGHPAPRESRKRRSTPPNAPGNGA